MEADGGEEDAGLWVGPERAAEPSGQELGLWVQIQVLLLHVPEQVTFFTSWWEVGVPVWKVGVAAVPLLQQRWGIDELMGSKRLRHRVGLGLMVLSPLPRSSERVRLSPSHRGAGLTLGDFSASRNRTRVREGTGGVAWAGRAVSLLGGSWRSCFFLTFPWRKIRRKINHREVSRAGLPFAPPGCVGWGRGSQDYWVPPCSQVTW